MIEHVALHDCEAWFLLCAIVYSLSIFNEDLRGRTWAIGFTCTGNTCRSPVLTGELVPVDWHGLPVQVTNGPDRSSEVLII